MSGLPLEISVKFQINMAMRDVSNMAHVERFSNIVIPMVWFEIVSVFQRVHSICRPKMLIKFNCWKIDIGKIARRIEESIHTLHQYIASGVGNVTMGSLGRRHFITIVCHYTCIDAIVIQYANIAQYIETTKILKHLSGHHSTARRIGQSV